ncbi:Bax inhibitor-1/YccA family protein [Salinispira pacifica]|uniref:Membrane protein n=1 Tax=Salinispira pacifica TaxID=1307761 RepID=V5WCL4_9SPIO|nr:Bax inhibitor-1/YccA family protein [Salinispira pacifica]AHC13523.1 membrane protein [Salinispira pacifica]
MNRENSMTFSSSAVMSRNLMRNVYIWMTLGLALTGVVAWGTAQNTQLVRTLAQNNGFLILMLVEVGLVFFISARIMQMSPMTATLTFAGYSALNGVTISFIFLAYTQQSIATTFFITAGMFGAMSIFAFVTRKDLSGWGSYLFMALIGVIIASLVNFFLNSQALSYIISYVGVLLFMGLTAYDTQRIKRMSDAMGENMSEPDYIRLSIMGALKLYLDFINMFLFLLRIFGGRR